MSSYAKTFLSKVCIRVWGGLANQMFQYAAGHATAQKLNCDLLVDPVSSKGDHASFGLDLFDLDVCFWQPPAALSLPERLRYTLRNPRGKTKKKHLLWSGPHYEQKLFCHTSDFDLIQTGSYMRGYFQSERFFANCDDELRQIFCLDHLYETIKTERLKLAAHPQSVSVHIRRGDYARNAKVSAVHGVLAGGFYHPAFALMRKLVPDGPVLVFSDDMSAADELTKDWPSRTLVRGQSREQDLYLMSQCSHHIIANSSFSWWGAWLGGNPNKTVIAPRLWFTREKLRNTPTHDLYPEGWIIL